VECGQKPEYSTCLVVDQYSEMRELRLSILYGAICRKVVGAWGGPPPPKATVDAGGGPHAPTTFHPKDGEPGLLACNEQSPRTCQQGNVKQRTRDEVMEGERHIPGSIPGKPLPELLNEGWGTASSRRWRSSTSMTGWELHPYLSFPCVASFLRR
jgi:hypothetical protein